MNIENIMTLVETASKYQHLNSSASLAFNDALTLFYRDDFEHTITRALTSLRHSIGILHPDYKNVAALFKKED